MSGFEIDQHNSVAGNQDVLRAEIGMHQADLGGKHFRDQPSDMGGGFLRDLGDAAIEGIDAQFDKDLRVAKLRLQFWPLCGVAMDGGKVCPQPAGD